jgi:hypothetical protein
MARHGMEEAELRAFQRAVYAACAGHLYPDLLGGEDLVHRPDVDGVAESLYIRCMTDGDGAHIVSLPAIVEELTAAVVGDRGPPPSPAQRRKQRTALAFARAGLGMRFHWARGGKARWASDLLDRNADFTAAHCGPAGLGGRLTVLGQRITAAFQRAHGCCSVPWARALLDLSEAAECRGETREADRACLRAVHCLADLQEGGYDALRPAALGHLRRVEEVEDPGNWDSGHFDLVWGALANGLDQEAGRQIASFEQWCSGSASEVEQWHEASAWLAVGEGDWGAAEALDPVECRAAQHLAERGLPASFATHVRLRARLIRAALNHPGLRPEPDAGE